MSPWEPAWRPPWAWTRTAPRRARRTACGRRPPCMRRRPCAAICRGCWPDGPAEPMKAASMRVVAERVAEGAQADVLARDLEAVVVLLHVNKDSRVGGRDLVGEVVAVTHVLGPPLRLLVQVGVVGQGVQAGGGAVLVGEREEELLVGRAEGRAGPGEGRGGRGDGGQEGKKKGHAADAELARRGVGGEGSDCGRGLACLSQLAFCWPHRRAGRPVGSPALSSRRSPSGGTTIECD